MDKPEFRQYLNEEFLDEMETLKDLIQEKYHAKKGLNDSIITGTRKYFLQQYNNPWNEVEFLIYAKEWFWVAW